MEALVPEHLEIMEVIGRGRGLFAKRRIEAGEEVLRSALHAYALNEERISVHCANCLAYTKTDGGELLRCSACYVTRFCSKDCQKAAWRAHKLECAALKARKDQHIESTPNPASVRVMAKLIWGKETHNAAWVRSGRFRADGVSGKPCSR